ncbi:MAG: cytochrome c biogenesis protein CcdA [Planctomycetota bacterium]
MHRTLLAIRPPRPLMVMIALFAIALGFGAPSGAQLGDPLGRLGLDGPAEADRPEVVVEAFAFQPEVAPGGELAIAVVLDHAEGFHTWPSADQDVLPESIAEFAIRTEAGVVETPWWIEAVGMVQWPEPHEVTNPLGEPPTVRSYKGRAVAYVPVIIGEDAEPGAQTVSVRVFFQACNDSVCLAPEERVLEVGVTIVAGDEVGAGDAAVTEQQRADFAGFDASVFEPLRAGIGVVSVGGERDDTGDGEVTDAAPVRTLFGLNFGSGFAGLLVASLIGGALLNLMPCVLPVIPIKIMTLSQHAQGSAKRTMVLGLWMAIGVAVFWIGVGVPVAATANAIDPSTIFSYWPVTLGMGVVIALMGLGIMGLFVLQLPQSVYMVNPKADSASGSFMFGVMTAVLGLPCFGPIVGGLLAGGAALPPSQVMTVFAGLGVGMAAPYLLLSARPALVKKVPQSGPAGELVKQSMGLLMLAAGVFFATTGVKTLLKNYPYLSVDIEYVFAGAFVLVAGLLVLVRTPSAAKGVVSRVVVAVIGLGLTAGTIWFVGGAIDAAREKHAQQLAIQEELGGNDGVKPGVWLEFSEARLARAPAEGYAVFIDFTADWCITCRAAKARTLDPEPASSRLKQGDVVVLEADFDVPEVKAFLKEEVGRTGIPAWVLYPPAADTPEYVDPVTTSSARLVELLDEATAGHSAPTGDDARADASW